MFKLVNNTIINSNWFSSKNCNYFFNRYSSLLEEFFSYIKESIVDYEKSRNISTF